MHRQICSLVVISCISFLPLNIASAQQASNERLSRMVTNEARAQAQTRAPASLRARARAVTVIKPADVHQTAEMSIKAIPTSPIAGVQIQALPTEPTPTPPRGPGSFQAAPQGKLNVTLTPKTPARNNRAYMSYEYAQRVSISNDLNYAVFSKGNVPGSLRYSVRLDKDKKYLIEVIADSWGTSGGNVIHSIGGDQTTHNFGQFNEKLNISRVVQPSENGWVSGMVYQGNNPTNQWRVYSVSFTEMD